MLTGHVSYIERKDTATLQRIRAVMAPRGWGRAPNGMKSIRPREPYGEFKKSR
jgi:hypothetical protein